MYDGWWCSVLCDVMMDGVCRAVVKGLEYKYQQSWRHVLKTLTVFHQVAGERCHTIMAQVSLLPCNESVQL